MAMSERPRTLLFEVSGIVEAPPERVAPMLPPPMQGGWWYRGESTAEPHPDGTRVVHRVFNVARKGRWAVPLANKMFIGYRANLTAGMVGELGRIGKELGVETHFEG